MGACAGGEQTLALMRTRTQLRTRIRHGCCPRSYGLLTITGATCGSLRSGRTNAGTSANANPTQDPDQARIRPGCCAGSYGLLTISGATCGSLRSGRTNVGSKANANPTQDPIGCQVVLTSWVSLIRYGCCASSDAQLISARVITRLILSAAFS